MGFAGGDEKQIGFAKKFAFVATNEFAATASDDVNFIAGVGLLRIIAAWRVDFDQQTPMGEQLERTKAQLIAPTGVELGSGLRDCF